jgi:hypothetical protein
MRSNPAHALRFGIDCLSPGTRRALLAAIGKETIIAGAYTDPEAGSLCPSVAVHRHEGEGGRRGPEDNLTGFARAWDAFTGAVPGQARVATDQELAALRWMLEASLAEEEARRTRLIRALGGLPGSSGAPEPAGASSEPPFEPAAQEPLEASEPGGEGGPSERSPVTRT